MGYVSSLEGNPFWPHGAPTPAKQAPELEPSQEPSTEELLTWELLGQGQHPWLPTLDDVPRFSKHTPPVGDSIPIIICIYIYHASGQKLMYVQKPGEAVIK